MTTPRLSSLVFSILLALAAGLASVAAAHAAEPTTITIHLAQCPAGYDGDDPFTDCHDNGIPDVTFWWYYDAPMEPVAVVTDADGVAFIDTEPLSIIEDPPFELASYSVYCSTNDGADEVPVVYSSQIPYGITLSNRAATGNVICDWYNVPAGGATDTGNDGPNAPATLPSTGVSPMNGGFGFDPLLPLAAACTGGLALTLRRRTQSATSRGA